MSSRGRFGSWFKRNGTAKSTDTDKHEGASSDTTSRTPSPSPSSEQGDRADESGLGGSEYARKRRELLRLARALANLGAGDLIDEVPRIVVIGAQSTGKSSLVEAVTGINVPRDSGTCTRCPMECTILTSASTWSCTISLRIVHDTQRGTPEVIPFSPMLTQREEVEVWIRAAQAAVLCPHHPRELFKGKTREELKALTNVAADPRVLSFTKNVVVIDIVDPRGADLSFVDLPGLIENATDDSLVPLVEDMVKSYIKSESTIILVTVPAADDLENTKALKLAREADPEKKRTIGIVTKPDGLTPGDIGKRETWQEIFDGKESKHQLLKGYYCVRLPTDQERRGNTSSARAEQIEQDFFSRTAPWKDLKSKRRLGVPNLVRDISLLLMTMIQAALPAMRNAAAEQLAGCRAELAALPQLLTSDATAEVIRCVVQFCDTMRGAVHGEREDKSFVHECRRRFRMFERSLRHTAPDFRPNAGGGRVLDPTELDERDDRDQFGAPPQDFTRYPQEPITLQDVTQVIRDATGWELPHNIPYEAKKRLIKGCMEHWPEAEAECFEHIAEALRKQVRDEAAEHFGRFPALEKAMSSQLAAQLEVYVSTACPLVKDALEREHAPYGTQNLPYLNKMRDLWLVRYKSSIPRPPYPKHLRPEERGHYEHVALTALRELGIQRAQASDLYSLLRLEDIDDEIVVMADVRSYFQVVYKRVADDIPEAIKLNLLFRFVDSLQAHLIGSLGLGAADAGQRMEALLTEDPQIARERKRLKERLARLEEIKQNLDNFTL